MSLDAILFQWVLLLTLGSAVYGAPDDVTGTTTESTTSGPTVAGSTTATASTTRSNTTLGVLSNTTGKGSQSSTLSTKGASKDIVNVTTPAPFNNTVTGVTGMHLFGTNNTSIFTANDTFEVRLFGDMESKVTGADRVRNAEDYPFLVSILYETTVACTGVLFSPRYILTSAYCFFFENKEHSYSVRLGSTNSYAEGITPEIKWIYIHPLYYSTDEALNDVAIIELERDVNVTKTVSPTLLASVMDPPELLTEALVQRSANCTLLGFGSGGLSRLDPGNLYKANVSLIPWEICINNYKSNLKFIPETEICAAAEKDNVCYNEIGAPLICEGKVYGTMVSVGECDKKRPSLFLSTDKIENFINLVSKCIDTPNECQGGRF